MLGIKSSKPGSRWGGALLLSCTPLQKSWLAWGHVCIIQEVRAGGAEVQGRPWLLCKHRAKLWCSMRARPPPQKSSSKVKWWLYLYKCLSKLEGHCYSVLLAWALGSPLVTVWSAESLGAMTPAPRDICMVLSLNVCLWDRWIKLTPRVVPCSCSPLPVPCTHGKAEGRRQGEHVAGLFSLCGNKGETQFSKVLKCLRHSHWWGPKKEFQSQGFTVRPLRTS